MSDIEELMRLHAATSTPALEQLCWYDVKPEQADFFEACLKAVPKLNALVRVARKAVEACNSVGVELAAIEELAEAVKSFERQP